jgi:hypothetical protein
MAEKLSDSEKILEIKQRIADRKLIYDRNPNLLRQYDQEATFMTQSQKEEAFNRILEHLNGESFEVNAA